MEKVKSELIAGSRIKEIARQLLMKNEGRDQVFRRTRTRNVLEDIYHLYATDEEIEDLSKQLNHIRAKKKFGNRMRTEDPGRSELKGSARFYRSRTGKEHSAPKPVEEKK